MKSLKVYSSNRSLRQHLDKNVLLSPHMMMNEFFTQLVIIDGYRALPKAMRSPLAISVLKEYANELGDKKLVFEKSFLAFLETSQFLFDFFNELAQAQVAIDSISLRDIYGDYDDHLKILEKIEASYKARLEAMKCYDGFILPKGAQVRINRAFLESFSQIDIYIDGILSKAHIGLLSEILPITKVCVHFDFDEFNAKLAFLPSKLLSQCKPFHHYSIAFGADIHSGELIMGEALKYPAKLEAYGFALRISQVALVFEKIQAWLKMGIKEEHIAIIVPDEEFIHYLALLDRAHNLNFAMGKDIESTRVYQCLKEMSEGESAAQKLSYQQICEKIEDALRVFDDRQSKKLRENVSELLFIWKDIDFSPHCFGEILELLLKELRECSIDDVMGGKIRVMGVLESRGLSCERVVIVDFNDGVIPSVSQSDLFLNSKIRKELHMPTIKDKEQLQKHYYCSIFSGAREVVVSYVENEDKHKSLLLEELAKMLNMELKTHNGDSYFSLFAQAGKLKYYEDEIKGEIPKILTPSKLKTLLECKRQYFYKYHEKLSELEEKQTRLGNLMHESLAFAYGEYLHKPTKLQAQKIYQQILQYCEGKEASNTLDRANIKFLQYELKDFLEKYEDGKEVEILCLEEDMEVEYGGFVFKMRPDRIQKLENRIEIIDYKYKGDFSIAKVENTTDFALILYMHAFKARYSEYSTLPIELYYWNIKNKEKQKFFQEKNIEAKDTSLLEKLASLQGEVLFSKCEKHTYCRYCAFKALCNR
ncbi:PD-(D/E)XK nuclease family protein [Helicobacter marmotae]|uniref:PD-(D/E)XK nuclease family protein n=1 Tax=Helicobacter marmotae TaxID=152490 RepID=UPI001F467655|nr:PD-(D/E)XK nuclease family protein [Helicobacter marmotae]